MCGRFARFTSINKIVDYFKIDEVEDTLEPSYNITPSNSVLGIVHENKKRKIRTFIWGFVPSWNKQLKPVINARIESIYQKPYFKNSINNRVLIIADGFYEWKDKIPYFIYSVDRKPILLGGIHEEGTTAIITTNSIEKIREIHPRMPLIIKEEDIESFFSENIERIEPFSNLNFCKVSRAVNNPKNNYRELISCI
ncbi:MAG: SOS response-associated peptidase [candidate division WOR-3 bacterium]|nr:SOS response-associated peptidase [candidate division WOR-3 bacterium]MCX7948101.1 SOS response-associated peptidase [candidate division WOR-3 bacterium]MDW8150821.1 SOS response-associated peptidase [candidate division WOR-3 bacterium]